MKIRFLNNVIEIIEDNHIISIKKSFANEIYTNLKNLEFTYYLNKKRITAIISCNTISQIYNLQTYNYKIDIDRFSISGICKSTEDEYNLEELKKFCNNLIKKFLNDHLELFN